MALKCFQCDRTEADSVVVRQYDKPDTTRPLVIKNYGPFDLCEVCASEPKPKFSRKQLREFGEAVKKYAEICEQK